MASMVAQASSSSCCPPMSVQEKGSRNKRKFRADAPLSDPTKLGLSQNDCPDYEFTAEKFEIPPNHGQSTTCEMCGVSQDHSDALKLNLGLPSGTGVSEIGPSRHSDEVEVDDCLDADWSDLTESQLEELVLANLDAIFKAAIKQIAACGYTEEVATRAVLRSGLCYGSKDTVSNVVDNTLAYLRTGQEIDPSRDQCFEDLQQLEKYILAELVCVLRAVRPFFSTGNAMWCLLICDMNVSHACAMDNDSLKCLSNQSLSNGSSSTFLPPDTKSEAKKFEASLMNPCKPIPMMPCTQGSHSELDTTAGFSNLPKPKNSLAPSDLTLAKDGSVSTSLSIDKPFSAVGMSHTSTLEEKLVSGRKLHSSKRESALRQKSFHLEKSYRTFGIKGTSRAGKLNGLMLDKKLKSMSDSAGFSWKSASLKISRAMGVDMLQDNKNFNLSGSAVLSSSSSSSFNLDTTSPSPNSDNAPAAPIVSPQPALSAADTELSLSLPTKSNPSPPVRCGTDVPVGTYTGLPYDKSLGQWVPRDRKDQMIMKLVPRIRELQSQIQEWDDWVTQKVTQATRRLGKDRAELRSLRQEKEEVERLKKEKQALEENTMKQLSEMENALCKAGGQVEMARGAIRRLEVENSVLRQEMEAAKLRAAESAASCQEISKREKNTLMMFQSWEKQRSLLQEELAAEKRKFSQLQQELEQAMDVHLQLEAQWKQEEKLKEDSLAQANRIRKEREDLEASSKSKEDMIRLKAETNYQKYKDDIERLEKEISQLRLKTDSSKIAALKRGIDGSYAGRICDNKRTPDSKANPSPYLPGTGNDFDDYSSNGGVKRERECVMCLSEEMSVVFLPCAHQVVCTMCNELHEKQGMKECPSCRSPIQRRIAVRYYARP